MPRRSRTRGGLSEWLSQTELPAFVVDSRRIVLFFNRGCERLTGWSAADLIGKLCEVRTDGDPGQLTTLLSAMAPPADPVAMSRRVHLFDHQGQGHARVAHFFPLRSLDGESDADAPIRWLGLIGPAEGSHVVSPISADSELHAELSALKSDLRRRYSFADVIAHESTMCRVLAQLRLAVPTNATIAFHGPTGTGKEHLARAVHYASENRVRAFVPMDCRLPTGPRDVQLSRLVAPDRDELPIPVLRVGAVLLQHVEALPRDWQRKLLDEVDLSSGPDAVRWMMASERDFADLVDQEVLLPEFRDRFGVLEVQLPSLRNRPGDLAFLAQHAMEECNAGHQRQLAGFSPEVWKVFRSYNWPGQLDELFAVVRESHDASDGPLITVPDLPFRFRTGLDAQSVAPPPHIEQIPLEELLMRVEKEQLLSALSRAAGSKQLAAELLGIPRAKLYRRLEAHGLWKPGEATDPAE